MRLRLSKGAVWLMAMLLFFALNPGASWGKQPGSADSEAYPRVVSLKGIWEFQNIRELSLPPMGSVEWVSVEIPKMDSNKESHFGAYRKRFKNPVFEKGERVFVHFNGVAFACEVYLNKLLVGRHGPTLEPFEMELKRELKEENELVVLVQDWTSGISRRWTPVPSSGATGQAQMNTDKKCLTQRRKGAKGGKEIEGGEKKKDERITDEFSPGQPLERALWYRTVSPMGSNYRLFGIWDDVWLEVVGDVRFGDLRVKSRVGEGKIYVRGLAQRRRGAEIEDVIQVKIKEGVRIKAEGEGVFTDERFEVVLDGKGLEVWEPGNPKMYRLVVEVPQYGYRKEIPFGYRTIETRGHELFLNGKKIHLFTASIGAGFTREQLEERLERLKGLNINAVRFHANVFPDWYYDVCDRMGMLVVAETAINGSYVIQNDYESDLFFENAAIHWKGMVGKLRYHPSMIAYSIENECVMYSHGKRAEEKFAELGRKVKGWDSTRPILFNGGDDPGGVADIVSLHYPHELPFWNRVPGDAWWLWELQRSEVRGRRSEGGDLTQRRKGAKKGTAQQLNSLSADPLRAGCRTDDGQVGMYIDSFWYHKPGFCWKWDKKKPLDLGEIGYFAGGKPHMDAILFGDWAYANAEKVRDRTRAEVWVQSIDAGRIMDVALMNPWNPPAGEAANRALKEVLEPLRLILYPGAWERYYGGKKVRWRGVILNDTRKQMNISFGYALTDQEGKELLSREMGPYSLAAGGREEVVIDFELPDVNEPQKFFFSGSLYLATDTHRQTQTLKGSAKDKRSKNQSTDSRRFTQMGGCGKTKDEKRGEISSPINKTLKVYPSPKRMPWGKLGRVLLIDPADKVRGLFQGLGVQYEKIDNIQKLGEKAGTLIIGPGALEKLSDSDLERLKERILNGDGSTLIMKQESYPLGFSPGLTLNDRHGTSLGFVAAPDHSVLKGIESADYADYTDYKGIEDRDVQLWAEDGLISRKDFNLPVGGGYTALVVGGGTGGLIYSPLLEKRGLKGTTIFCQLQLVEKFWQEPAASHTLFNILEYLSRHEEARQADLDLPKALMENLADWGILCSDPDVSGGAKEIRLMRAEDLPDTPSEISEMLDWVRKGNVLWVFDVRPDNVSRLNALAPGLRCVSFPKETLPIQIDRETPLTEGLLNQFFYWTGPYGVFTYRFARLIQPAQWALEVDDSIRSRLQWKSLCTPALLMTAAVGAGRVVVDSLNWLNLTEYHKGKAVANVEILKWSENKEMAVRILSGLLTNLGAQMKGVASIRIEAENMAEKTPGQPLIRNRNHHYWGIFSNNYVAQGFDVPQGAGHGENDFVVEVKARCRDWPAKMKLFLDGEDVGECLVEEVRWRIYRFRTDMKPGAHRVEVYLTNNPQDAYNHRYLHVDYINILAAD